VRSTTVQPAADELLGLQAVRKSPDRGLRVGRVGALDRLEHPVTPFFSKLGRVKHVGVLAYAVPAIMADHHGEMRLVGKRIPVGQLSQVFLQPLLQLDRIGQEMFAE